MKIRSCSIALCAMTVGLAGSGSVVAIDQHERARLVATADTIEELKPGQTVPSSNPLSGDPEAIALGKRLYFTWCSPCHGAKADGETPRFGKYGANLTTFFRGYKEFVVIVKEGRPGKQMPPWKTVLDDDNIAKIGAYLETLAQPNANWR